MRRISWYIAFAILLAVGVTAALPSDSATVASAAAENPDTNSAITAADRLYRSGKFAEAENSFQALVQMNPKLVPAQVGLIWAMLKQQKIDESLDVVNAALAAQPTSAALLAAKGDVLFRRGEMSDAERAYRAALDLDGKQVRAHLGLARLYSSYSLFRHAYDELQVAHDIAPNDRDVQRAWWAMLPRRQRLANIEAYLAANVYDEQEATRMKEYVEFLRATVDQPVHACRLVGKIESTDTKLEPMFADANHIRSVGLSANVNGHRVHLLLDTGAGGIVMGRKAAEKIGLNRISSMHYGGIGDKGWQTGYTAVADRIQIGELEFQDCVVSVTDKRSIANEDGLIGADVLRAYLIDIDIPAMRLRLSPLPKHPEDIIAPTSLNTSDEGPGVAEAQQSSAAGQGGKAQNSVSPAPNRSLRLPRDRYVAPEMANWTKVFRSGHMILVPTMVNGSEPMLFGLDTGAPRNLLSVRAGRQVSKLRTGDPRPVQGLSGRVEKVYSSDSASLRFGHLQHDNTDIVTIDLSPMSGHLGTEISGYLGFALMRLLRVKLDYRDGLVDFEYDPKRVPTTMR